MKKVVKKSISVFLIIVMLIVSIPFFELTDSFSAYAIDEPSYYNLSEVEEMVSSYYNVADDVNIEDFLTAHYTTSPTIDLIHIGMDNITVAPGFVEDMQKNPIFQTAYAEWEFSTFFGNPGDTIAKLLNKEMYYETILFRLLNSSIDSDNAIDWLNQGAIKHSVKFCKYLATASEIDYRYDISSRFLIADLSDAEKEHIVALSNNYVNSQNYKTIGNDLSFVSDVLSMSKSIEEYSERLATYMQLAQLSDTTIAFLEILKTNSDNELLTKALETVLAVSSESFSDFMKVAAKDGALTIGKTAIKSLIGKKWKELLISKLTSGVLSSGWTIVNGVLIANSLGQTISNILFSTNKKLDHYELTKALVATENTIKNTVNNLLSEKASGSIISKGIELLYGMYALDCDLCLELVATMDKDWIKLSTTEERNEAKSNINTVKNFYSNQYNRITPKSGSCGDNLYWLFDSMSGELLIYGYGKMNDFSKESTPWYSYKDSIRSIYISSLCTQVGSYAFYNLNNIRTPIILTSYTKNAVIYKDSCFSSINTNTPIIFTEDAKIYKMENSSKLIYALKSLYCYNGVSFQELHVNSILNVSGSLTLETDGLLFTNTLKTNESYFKINENATVEIYDYAEFIGRNYNSVLDIYYNAMEIQSGANLNIYGDAIFRSGKFYAYSGSRIMTTGNCTVGGGGIQQQTYFYNYGDFFVDGKLTVTCGYCTIALLRIYGTLTVGDFSSLNAVTCITGSAYITDESVSHDLSGLVTRGTSAYLSVHGKASSINRYSCDTMFTDIGMGPCEGTIELYNDAYFSEPREPVEKNLTVIFSGNKPQEISGYAYGNKDDSITAGTFIINNDQGVIFKNKVTSLVLFNHNQNPFTLQSQNNTFQDYDFDGLLDNVDPYPLDPLNGQNNTDFTVEISNYNLTITGYIGTDKNVIIPDAINGICVTNIDSDFEGCNFESITIGSNVSSISTTAFNKVNTLKTINVSGKNETFASENGVLYTKNYEKIIKCPIKKSDTSFVPSEKIKEIAPYAFYKTSIKNITIPDSVTTISSNAFSYSFVETIRIAKNVSVIGLNAFSNCVKLKTVYYDAVNCSATTSIFLSSIFPSNVKNFIIGEKVEYLPAYLLKNAAVSEITIPASVISINKNAFYNFSDLSIKAYVNSCAKEYAEMNGYDFIPITCGNCICDEWEILSDATCTSVGEKTGICSVCGATVTSEIPMKDHSYGNWIITKEATCKSGGIKTKTCANCDDAVIETISKLEHTDANGDGVCDNCGTELETGNPSTNCTHICHNKNSFVQFIYKIVGFFWKLFGINKYCECGIAHY